jgi:hypothetical protein
MFVLRAQPVPPIRSDSCEPLGHLRSQPPDSKPYSSNPEVLPPETPNPPPYSLHPSPEPHSRIPKQYQTLLPKPVLSDTRGALVGLQFSSELGTYKTVKAKLWP